MRVPITGGISATVEAHRRGATVRTPFGRDLYVACSTEGVVESRFVVRRRTVPHVPLADRDGLLGHVLDALDAYFSRMPVALDVPLVFGGGTSLQVDTWRAVAALPFGAVVSYADVARAVGRPNAHRGVASALAKTPLALFIPAHRVVGADGCVRGASPGSMRRRLLAFEARPKPRRT